MLVSNEPDHSKTYKNNNFTNAPNEDWDQPAGNKLEGDLAEIVFLQAQTSPYFQPREKF